MKTICNVWRIYILSVAMLVVCQVLASGDELDAKGVVVNGDTTCEVERRAFPDGVAVRYKLPDCVATVLCERTEWRLPAGAHIWYQPQNSCYETPFRSCPVHEVSAGEMMNLPITARLADGTYRLLTEANVVDYTDSCVEYCGDGRFAIRYYADEKGFVHSGVPHTPWRVTLVAKDLQALATSDIVRRLCPDPSPEVAEKAAKFVRPGRAVWQWLPAGDPKYGEQKEWYDRTKALGFEYYLIDDGWKVWRDGDMDQWACLKKWIDYGKSIGVESFVWVDSKEMLTSGTRRAYLQKVSESGAVGIKIDFVPKPSCSQMRWYEETLADTLAFSLMTDFHGCVKPSGRERTWPHEVAREAIRGHEWHITRYGRMLPPEHDCILPFNRLVQGHADYTPVVFEKKELQGYSWARELAQGVVFSSPFLCFGDYPQNYLDNPAVELIKTMPPEYDETRILPGSEIGKCVAVAKRKGRDWFVAVENGAEERRVSIKLDFLGADKCELLGFADAETRPDGYRIDSRVVDRTGKIDLMLRSCGGYCARIIPAKGIAFADEDGCCPVSTNVRGHENVEWSTTYAFGLTDETKDLPRVLLVGDSICNGYQEGVRQRLKGKMNVSYWISSYCTTSAAYLPLLSICLDDAKYDVVHFNNGLHSLDTPTDAWANGIKSALELIRRKQPEAKIVWCTSTPLTNEVKTAKSRELNAAGSKVVAELGGIATDDLFALCDSLDRITNWSDMFHFRPEAKARQADQVAAAVLSALNTHRGQAPSPAIAAGLAFAAHGAKLDPLEMRWTFGAHEPYTMYRRVGRHCTGGIDGNARWLKPWMDWFDAESPALMEEHGLNWLHCRFYKGMGWEEEKKDFPNVKRFVENCHRHGVRALAYVQFATLYPETMKREIANLDEWAQVDADGRHSTYYSSYFRWLPCVTCDEWVEYLKKVCTIALAEGDFDGIMFDNAWAQPCYCKRCESRFQAYLAKVDNPAERFGFDDLSFIMQPCPAPKDLAGEIRDSVVQAWLRWRQETLEDVFARLRAHIKSVKPDAVVCANPQPVRSEDPFLRYSLNLHRFVKILDLVMMQSDNFPEVTANGEIRNRVRDLKLCRELGKPVVALCDSDAKLTDARERHYLLPLMEDLIWGGVPTDRTIVSPKPMPGFVDKGMVERRRPQLAAFNAFARAHRGELAAPSYLPVRLLWTPDVIGFSQESHLGLAAAEEIMLRNQVPFGYVIAESGRELVIPNDCEVLVVANQLCLSDAQIAAIAAYAKRGGKLVVTGDSGRYDEWNAHRLENPLKPQLAGLSNVVSRDEADTLPYANLGWVYEIAAPKDGGTALMADLAKTGYDPSVRVEGAPPHVFAEFKRTEKGLVVFLLNYNPDVDVKDVSLKVPAGSRVRFETMLDDVPKAKTLESTTDGAFLLPTFRRAAIVYVEDIAES